MSKFIKYLLKGLAQIQCAKVPQCLFILKAGSF